MVGIGVLMLAMAWFGAWRSWRGEALPRWFKRGLAAMTFSGWFAVVSGWLVTEIGRQPWLISGRADDGRRRVECSGSSIAALR